MSFPIASACCFYRRVRAVKDKAGCSHPNGTPHCVERTCPVRMPTESQLKAAVTADRERITDAIEMLETSRTWDDINDRYVIDTRGIISLVKGG